MVFPRFPAVLFSCFIYQQDRTFHSCSNVMINTFGGIAYLPSVFTQLANTSTNPSNTVTKPFVEFRLIIQFTLHPHLCDFPFPPSYFLPTTSLVTVLSISHVLDRCNTKLHLHQLGEFGYWSPKESIAAWISLPRNSKLQVSTQISQRVPRR
jgi:hypothetical protein